MNQSAAKYEPRDAALKHLKALVKQDKGRHLDHYLTMVDKVLEAVGPDLAKDALQGGVRVPFQVGCRPLSGTDRPQPLPHHACWLPGYLSGLLAQDGVLAALKLHARLQVIH